MPDKLPRIAILISGTGTNMVAICEAIKSGELKAEVAFVGSSKAEAKGVQSAQQMGFETKIFSYKDNSRLECEEMIAKAVEQTNTDWIVLAGFMKILSPAFVKRFAGKIINIHPAMLPKFPGAHAIQDAWNAGVEETGVTIHIVDEEVDHGPILKQEAVKRLPTDTIETLEARIHKTEHRIYKQALIEFFQNK